MSGRNRRPGKCTDDTLKGLCHMIRVGVSKRDACAEMRITDRTLRDWRKRDPSIDEQFLEAEAFFKNRVVQKIVQHGNKDAKPLMWLLEKRFPLEYGSRATIQHSGDVSVDFKKLSDETLERIIREGGED